MDKQRKIRAALCCEFGSDLEITDVVLDAPKENEVQVKIAASAICHSDIAAGDGAWGGDLPAIFGHEAAGVIVAKGTNVNHDIGTRVLVTLIRACGECTACGDGDPTSCDHAYDAFPTPLHTDSGAPIRQGMATAAFAEYVNVDASQIVTLPDNLPMDTASLLACGVITGVGAVKNSAKLRAGQSAVVIGAGGVGLNAIQGAKLLGADPIIAVDVREDKLETAREMGATHGLISREDLADQVRAATNGRGADYVFVTVGAPSVFASAPELLAPGGAVVMVGLPPSGTAIEYDPTTMAAMNQRLIGSRMGQSNIKVDIPYLLTAYEEGTLKLDTLISKRYAFDQINEAIAETKKGGANRNVIIFDETRGN